MNSQNYQHPDLMSAEYVQKNIGLSRHMTYALLNRQDCGVVHIGRRKFFHRDTFLKWLADQANPQKGGNGK